MPNNKELLSMCEELEEMCDQLNNMSYNNKDDRNSIDAHLNKLDLMYDNLNGDVAAKKQYTKTPKAYKQ